MGTATLNSKPDGAAVTVDGVVKGVTPISLQLTAGPHEVVLRNENGERRVSVTVENGTRVVENLDMPMAAAAGQLDVSSEPSGARVQLDGTAVGQTPLKLRSVSAGRHEIVVTDGNLTTSRTIELAAGGTATVVLSLGKPSATVPTGSVAVESPIELHLLENGQLLGVSNAAPLPLSPGKHQFELVNETLEVRLARTVTVDAGKTAHIGVPAPTGTLSVNATPWAEVSVDGRIIGVTPLGDVAVPVGTREITWRHPQFGERKRSVVVGAQTPVHIGMDMSR
jgi:hypothetical protein